MPLARLVILWSVHSGYISMLFDYLLDNTIIMTGAGFQVIGMVVIKHLIKIKMSVRI
ncbi:hypothetical protein DFAR_1830013 [Desulfarculales bacterium]